MDDLQNDFRELEERALKTETSLKEAPAKIAQQFQHLSTDLTNVSKWIKASGAKERDATNNLCLLVIAGLLKLLFDRNRPHHNQGTASDAISKQRWRGVGKRNIDDTFAAAKRAETEASLEAEE
ncbi:hypothetical protein [uncultured Halopseudomonas sp.]|uniref:hypothetical protein n=1 Tax=uncultured Halopseudomonas sp. TaxID=2901193 RepID=UPI0030EB144E